ncbi:MAG: SagB family peptide dehydrogenase [Arcobacteraceae bacterium]
MQTFHDATNITLKKYYGEPHFIDWSTQPRSYKIYPHFYRRFSLDEHPSLAFIQNIGKTTFEKTYYNDTIRLRTNPSAGGLYPCEVYVQIRGVQGVVSGIYHYEPLNNSVVLLHELTHDGVEFYGKDQTQYQFTFFISCAYFRSAWKYGKRSIRYVLLDLGHQMGAIYAALCLENTTAIVDFEYHQEALNEALGFSNEEFVVGCIKVNSYKETPTLALRQNLPVVQPCDYFIRDAFIEAFFQKNFEQKEFTFPRYEALKSIPHTALQEAINSRRSIRAFKKESINKEDFLEICQDIFELALANSIEIFTINNNIEGFTKGLYKNVTLQKEGNFEEIASSLALFQNLAKSSCATLFFTAKSTTSYSHTTLLCGFLAHMIYLKATLLNVGCSGIGAYFDDDCQTFLETSNNILYLVVLGK